LPDSVGARHATTVAIPSFALALDLAEKTAGAPNGLCQRERRLTYVFLEHAVVIKRLVAAFWEWARATTPAQSQIRYKLATYYDGWRANRHVEQLGLKQARIVIVTSSAARMENMLSLLDRKGSAFCLFADREALASTNPLKMDWINGKREIVRLTD
jgi:hypothetical protein